MFPTAVYFCIAIPYLAALIFYLHVWKAGYPFVVRLINKAALSATFTITGIVGTILSSQMGTIQWRLAVGLVFCFLGDILLLKSFSVGGTLFGTGNIFIYIYMITYLAAHGLSFGKFWYTVLLTLIAGLVIHLFDVKGIAPIKHKFVKICYPPYIMTVCLHGFLGLFALLYLHDLKSVLLFAGCALYMVSDFFLWQSKFNPATKAHPWVHHINSLTYFIGMLMVAFSASVPMAV